MSIFSIAIQTIGGLGLFILGMKTMTEGLQLSAGHRIKKILSAVSSNRIAGCITGACVTALIQSSSATTVMLISFASAGMMTLQQAVGVILGANIGTTVTAQMIAFNLTDLALPAIAVGVVMKYFSKHKQYRYFGDVILGFGLLFFGMTVMKQGLAPIKDHQSFIEFFTRFDPSSVDGLLLCVFTGTILTVMVQSSSATIGLTMTLSFQGLLSLPAAMALVLGENIGTTITAQLARLGATDVNAHRTANAHTLFNIIGVAILLPFFPLFVKVVVYVTELMGAGGASTMVNGEAINVGRYIANGHTMFNVTNAIVFLTFFPWLIRATIKISPKPADSEDYFESPSLDDRYVNNPIAALAQVRSEIIRMSEYAETMLSNTSDRLKDRNLKELLKWRYYEDHLDETQREITSYLTTIYQGDVNASEAKEISSLMRITNNIERIGDSVENIALGIEEFIEKKVEFSPEAMSDMEALSGLSMEFLVFVIEGLRNGGESIMAESQAIEDAIDVMKEEMNQNHISRLRDGICTIEQGLMYIDMLSNYEKIGDYCYNIAQSIAGVK